MRSWILRPWWGETEETDTDRQTDRDRRDGE